MKLTIELVPKTSWFRNLRSLLSTEEWDIIRRRSYKKNNYRCVLCGGKGPKHPVECHEVWEYDDIRHTQKLVELISLCPDCHMVKHIGLAKINGNFEKAIKHFMLINNMSYGHVCDYINDVFALYLDRSKKKWSVDISFIDNYIADLNIHHLIIK